MLSKALKGFIMNRKEKIELYFKSWLQKKDECFDDIFSKEITYYECYGPFYHGLETLHKWFQDWQRFGSVLEWKIRDYIESGNQAVVTWYFHSVYEGEEDAFDGVSIIRFDENEHIIELKEYQSTLPHTEIQLK